MTQFAFPGLGVNSGYASGRDGWKAGYDANMAWLYQAARGRVINTTLTTLPGSPTTGDAYIVASSGTTGPLVGKENQVAVYGESTWYYMPAEEGSLTFYDVASGVWKYFNGTTWVADKRLENDLSLRVPSQPVLGTTGTTTITREESAAPILICVVSATEAITVRHDVDNLDVVPAVQYLINYFCPYPTTLRADDEDGITVPVAGAGAVMLVDRADPTDAYLDAYALLGWAFNTREAKEVNLQGDSGPASFNLVDQYSGTIMHRNDKTQHTTLVLEGSPDADRSMELWKAYCESPEGVTLSPETGTAYGYGDEDVILPAGEYAHIVRDRTTDDYYVYKFGSPSNNGGRRDYSSSSNYTLQALDLNRLLDCTHDDELEVEVPNSSTTEFGMNAILRVRASGEGGVTLTAAGGVTLIGRLELVKGETALIRRQDATETWYVEIMGYSASNAPPIKTNNNTTYSFVKGDKGRVSSFTNGSPITATIEPSSTTDMGEDCVLQVFIDTAGGFTLAAGSGVTIKGVTAPSQNQLLTLRRIGTSETWWSY